ncbi:MAG: galactokinase family protein [Candidatus Promineifilaceae bacterium]
MHRLSDLLEMARHNQQIVLSPYRINPLGAHVDHQGGPVLGRSIDLYTAFAFDSAENQINVSHANTTLSLTLNSQSIGQGWHKYLQGAVAALNAHTPLQQGLTGYVSGSLLGAGLSSSASVLLAYLVGLATVNGLDLSQTELVELVRQVENEHLGLNNGVQDQMCIAYGHKNALTVVDSLARTVTYALDPPHVEEVGWLLAYSGFSRELVGSGFNTRVAECREAARQLDPRATILCDVSAENRTSNMPTLAPMLQRRAAHFFSEVARVRLGATLWSQGDWVEFGRKMNQSCHSSITQYESGSRPVNKLHEIMSSTTGVYGSRFCGGGYGGCVVALVDQTKIASAADSIREQYLNLYPEKQHVADVFQVHAENGVRLLST